MPFLLKHPWIPTGIIGVDLTPWLPLPRLHHDNHSLSIKSKSHWCTRPPGAIPNGMYRTPSPEDPAPSGGGPTTCNPLSAGALAACILGLSRLQSCNPPTPSCPCICNRRHPMLNKTWNTRPRPALHRTNTRALQFSRDTPSPPKCLKLRSLCKYASL